MASRKTDESLGIIESSKSKIATRRNFLKGAAAAGAVAAMYTVPKFTSTHAAQAYSQVTGSGKSVIIACDGPGIVSASMLIRGIRFTVDQNFCQVRIWAEGREAGEYSFTAELRRGSDFQGAADFSTPGAFTATGDPGTHPFVPVLLDFGEVSVTGSETFTLMFKSMVYPVPTGSLGAFFEGRSGLCPDVEGIEDIHVHPPEVYSVDPVIEILG